MQPAHHRGFSLIELMIVIAVVGLLIALALPNVSSWIQNNKTRAVAESMQNGLRFAEAQAASMNRATYMFFPTTSSWEVDFVKTLSDAAATTTLQTSSAGNNLNGAIITAGTGSPAVLVFNGLGRVTGSSTTANAIAGTYDASLPSPYAVYNVTNPNAPRKLNVEIWQSGRIRMCDPDAASTRPDACP